MKKPAGKGGSSRNPGALKEDDARIWEAVKKTVDPLHPLPALPLSEKFCTPAQPPKPLAGKLKTKTSHSTANVYAPPPAPKPSGPHVAKLNRRDTQKLSRGNTEIDARLDLHGLSVERGRIALLNFLEDSRQRSLRTVLVITGKGASPYTRHTLHSSDVYHAPERRGRLRSALPQWMSEHVFAEHVAGFQPAHPRHGGGGAFYVRLRRKGGRK